jgi:D-psicose/D-tagatose/L-ribulose 3-epimerase
MQTRINLLLWTSHVRADQWRETFRELRLMNYDGWMTIEACGRLLPEVAAATRVWRDFFPSPEDLYERVLKFIKTMWDEAGR